MSATAESGCGAPVARRPAPETAASAVPVPMGEIVRGKMASKVAVAGVMIEAVMDVVATIKSMIVKSVSVKTMAVKTMAEG